jgi:hypothetical protein
MLKRDGATRLSASGWARFNLSIIDQCLIYAQGSSGITLKLGLNSDRLRLYPSRLRTPAASLCPDQCWQRQQRRLPLAAGAL